MRGPGVARIGKACVRRMAAVVASRIRRFIPRQLKPNSYGSGIGHRAIKGLVRSKAGVAVGRAGKIARVVQRGHGVQRTRVVLSKSGELLGRRSTKFQRFTRTGRKGVGISAANLHWFALGTQERYTGATKGRATGKLRRYTGRIAKEKFGQFVPRGAQAAQPEALAAAVRVANRMIPLEVQRARAKGFDAGSGAMVELGIDD